MKTITLTEEAYERLVSWKSGSKDSFSKVIDRVVPRKGTLASILEAAKHLPALSEDEISRVEEAARSNLSWN